MKKRSILIVVLVVIVSLIVFSIFSQTLTREKTLLEAATPVITGQGSLGSIRRQLHYAGTLQANRTITLLSRVAGKIEELRVREGDFVVPEQTLIKIDNEIVSYQKDQAYSLWRAADAQFARAKRGVRTEELENTRASIAQAEADLTLAEENFARTQNLYNSGAIARAKFDEAANMLQAAQTSLANARRSLNLMEQGASAEEIEMALANADAARAQYNLATLQFDSANIQASEVGLVARVLVEEGNLVGTTTPILLIMQIDPIVAKIPVPEMYYGQLSQRAGEIPVRVNPQAFPRSSGFSGVVSHIAPVIDPSSRTFSVEISIPNPQQQLRPGMYVNVELELEAYTDTLLLPRTAVLSRDGREVVFLISETDPPVCRQVEVTTGLRDDDSVQILQGVTASDRIILAGNLFLEDGQGVQIKQEIK